LIGALIGITCVGDAGTGGKEPRGGGRWRILGTRGMGGRSNEERIAVAGAGGKINDLRCAGADGGSWVSSGCGDGLAVSGVKGVRSSSSSLGLLDEAVVSAKPPPTPRRSCSSSSSTKSSLRMLPVVRLLAMEPVRLRPFP
jgi:hypothetical protein